MKYAADCRVQRLKKKKIMLTNERERQINLYMYNLKVYKLINTYKYKCVLVINMN